MASAGTRALRKLSSSGPGVDSAAGQQPRRPDGFCYHLCTECGIPVSFETRAVAWFSFRLAVKMEESRNQLSLPR
jgi:hypothetical protein